MERARDVNGMRKEYEQRTITPYSLVRREAGLSNFSNDYSISLEGEKSYFLILLFKIEFILGFYVPGKADSETYD